MLILLSINVWNILKLIKIKIMGILLPFISQKSNKGPINVSNVYMTDVSRPRNGDLLFKGLE